ncbi:MAG TPA: DUF3795 domain-containing protein [Terracidiphilus sp.]
MATMTSSCGVLCSDCPAYLGDEKGVAHQQRTAAAWKRIYGVDEAPENIACHGCLGPEDQLFHSSRTCRARVCCHSKGFGTCAECPEEQCPALEKAQSLWDGVPNLAGTLSPEDFATYAQPYCGHRARLAEIRMAHVHHRR